MSSRNNLKVRGHLSRVEFKPHGDNEMVSVSICSSEYLGKDEAGQPRYHEQWFNAAAFQGIVDRIKSSGIKKGDYVELIGPYRSKTTTKEDRTYVNWTLFIDEFDIIRRKDEDGDQSAAPAKPAKAAPAEKPAKAAKAAEKPAKTPEKKPEPAPEPSNVDDFDDDIPF